MGIITKPFTFKPHTRVRSSEVNACFDTIIYEFNGRISKENLAPGSVGTDELMFHAVAAHNIKDKAVTREKIADNAIATEQLNDNAVITSKIAEKAVTPTKVQQYCRQSFAAGDWATASAEWVVIKDMAVNISVPMEVLTLIFFMGNGRHSGGGEVHYGLFINGSLWMSAINILDTTVFQTAAFSVPLIFYTGDYLIEIRCRCIGGVTAYWRNRSLIAYPFINALYFT